MKKIISLASAYLGRVGFYFLLTILIFAFVALATANATFNLVLVWSALLFAALLGLADGIFSLKFLSAYTVKAIIHVVLTVAAFAVSFVLVSGVIESGRSAVWSIFLFALLATVVGVIRGVVHMLLAKKQNERKSYDYLYMPKE